MAQKPIKLTEGESLGQLHETLLVHAQRSRSDNGQSPLDERTVRLMREILDGVRVGPGQVVYLARYPIETSPPMVEGEPEPEQKFVTVAMRTQCIALQNDSISDEEFARRARESIRHFMDGAATFFVYRLAVGPSHENARAWTMRFARA